MVNAWDLEKFLKEHKGEWWTPHEIKTELGGDIRTVYNVIRSLIRRPWEMTKKGWRLDVAERRRIYCVRMVRDIGGSDNLMKDEISKKKPTLHDFPMLDHELTHI